MNARRAAGRGVAALLFAVAGYYAVLGGEYTLFDLLRLKRAQAEEAARLAEVRAEADSLAHVAELLENDRAAIEEVARERFGMIRDGEVLYRFVEVDEPKEDSVAD